MRMETIRKPEDHETQCPTCGGGVQRRSFGEMYAGSFISDGKRVDIRAVPHEHYADPIVLDALTQYFDGGLYRLWPSEKYLSRGGKKLHRDVWALAFGPIPKGCHIHHKDSNPRNNQLNNLECLPASLHLSETSRRNNALRTEHFTPEARAKASDWHRSEEGRLWHRRHNARFQPWTKWKYIAMQCPGCNQEFQGISRQNGYSQKFCTEKCKMLVYRKRKRGLATR